MEVKLNLNYEVAEPIVVGLLKEQYEILLKDAPLGFEDEDALRDAYKLVLEDFIGRQELQKYMHDIAKKNKKYNSKRLTEAEGGL